MINKVLVLGATGHLGANTAVYLKENGYDVYAVGHRVSDNRFFATKGIKYFGGFSLENASDYNNLPNDIDAVVHLAGTMPAHADNNPIPYIKSIVEGMVNLCEWVKTTSCRRIIFNTTPSDVCAHFGDAIPVKDDAIRSFPKDGGDHAVYAIAKNAAVDILEHYKYAHGISSCIFRHLTIYGYHPNPFYYVNGMKKILPWKFILNRIVQGQNVEIWGNPDRKKELLYIKDFTRAIHCALQSKAEGIFNLSGYKPYTLEDQITGFIEVFSPINRTIEKKYCPDKPDTPQNLLDSTKAIIELCWNPKYDWISACKDMKVDMENEPFAKLWGTKKDYPIL